MKGVTDMDRRTKNICGSISLMFFLVMLAFYVFGSGNFIYAFCAAAVLVGLQFLTWFLSSEKNFITYALSFLPACALAPSFVTGEIAFSPWFWACLALFATVLVLSRLKWAESRMSTLYWLGTACFMVIFSALAGVLYTISC